jgi:sucrose-6-phosphate hydrolase SacC (GH32 family)
MRKVRFRVDNQVVRFFEIEWAEGIPDFRVFTDVSEFNGERLVIEIDGAGKKHPTDVDPSSMDDSENLEAFVHSDTIEGGENLYREKYRPQFHFTSRRGWLNDPNGLVYYKGTYHLFYQHNPYGRKWGNMHWGHVVSKNLVQWQEFSDVFYPDAMGTMFSGSAIVDWDNTARLKDGSGDPLICFYTAAGGFAEPKKVPFTQCMAFSIDSGQTWQKYEDNPILPRIGYSTRDPKVVWHSESRQWIMALYIGLIKERTEDPHHFALFASSDLKDWNRLQDFYFPGLGECPDFFPLPLDGDPKNIRWVLWTADGYYLIGKFDGSKFTPEMPILNSTYSAKEEIGCGFAAQTWSDIPSEDGRRIQIAWLVGDLPGMPFNQQMTFPVQLTLQTTEDGPRLHSWPVKEIELLYQEVRNLKNIHLSDQTVLPTDGHDLLDIQTVIEVGDADEIELNLRGIPLIYDVNKQEISFLERTTQLKTKNGNIQMRVLLDRTSVEIYAADGLVYIPYGVIPEDHNTVCFLQARGGTSLARTIKIIKLVSSWE